MLAIHGFICECKSSKMYCYKFFFRRLNLKHCQKLVILDANLIKKKKNFCTQKLKKKNPLHSFQKHTEKCVDKAVLFWSCNDALLRCWPTLQITV